MCPNKLNLLAVDFLVATFGPADAPVHLAVDDSLFDRTNNQ